MNRLFIIITILSLTIISLMNCTDRSSITSSDPNEEPDQPTESAEGGVAFTFTSSNAKANGMVAYAAETDGFPEPTNVRVIVRRYVEDQYGRKEINYNTLGDVKVPTDTTMVLSVPVADDYQIVAFSYVDSSASFSELNYLLKHDIVSDISVSADSVNHVSLRLESIYPEFTLPDSVDKGDQFIVGVNFNEFGIAPKRQFLAYISTDSTYSDNIVLNLDNRTNASSYSDNDFVASWERSESELEDRYIYFRTQFLLTADEYYKTDESNFPFRFYYPSPFMSNDTLKTFIKVPEGGIGVTVEY